MSIVRAEGVKLLRLWRIVLAAVAVVTVAAIAGGAVAQQGQLPAQIALTAQQVQNYVAAFKEMGPLFEKLDASAQATGGKPDPKLMALVEASVKKYGFRDLDEYDQVVVSIVAVLDGVDPGTRQYSDPVALIKKEIAAVAADKTMKPEERKKALESLNAELSEVQPVMHPGNIPLVIKYFDQLNPAPPQQQPPPQAPQPQPKKK